MIGTVYLAADTTPVEETNRDALCEELAALEAAEARVSAERRRLHQQMDYSASESLRAREQEVSAQRRELHRRIDALQQLLGIERTALVLAQKRAASVRELEPEIEPERPQFFISG
jgi:septal ring factor EnvC (AmiA/AmiB activator)